MKKVLSVLLLLFIGFAAAAQPKKMDPEKRIAQMNKNMKEQLQLSDDQYAKVVVLNTNFVNEMAANREMEDKEAMKKSRDVYHTELEKVLTKEQMATFEAQLKQRKKENGLQPKGPKM